MRFQQNKKQNKILILKSSDYLEMSSGKTSPHMDCVTSKSKEGIMGKKGLKSFIW